MFYSYDSALVQYIFIDNSQQIMKQEQLLRFVQQISFLLKLSQPCSRTALQFFLQFKSYSSNYNHQILIGSSIYLAAKIFQEDTKIRDILNMVYVITSLYKISQTLSEQQNSRQQQTQKKDNRKEAKQNIKMIEQAEQAEVEVQAQQQYVNISKVMLASIQNLQQVIQPKYSLSDYNQYKGKIIEAEQYLLRIIGFNFSLSQKNKKQVMQLLIMIHHLRMPQAMAQNAVRLYNDLQYIQIQSWLQGIIYFSYLSTKILAKEQMRKRVQNEQNKRNEQQAQLKEEDYSQNNKQNEYQLQIIDKYEITNQKFEEYFCSCVKSLRKYAQKLVLFYEQIQTKSNSKVEIQRQEQHANESTFKKKGLNQQQPHYISQNAENNFGVDLQINQKANSHPDSHKEQKLPVQIIIDQQKNIQYGSQKRRQVRYNQFGQEVEQPLNYQGYEQLQKQQAIQQQNEQESQQQNQQENEYDRQN